MNFFSGNSARIPGVALRASGLPKVLGPLAPLLENYKLSYESIRVLMTILVSTRSLKTLPLADTSPITEPLKKGSIVDGKECYAEEFWKNLGYRHKNIIPRALLFKRFHFSSKSGPNGLAMKSWITDILLLPEKLKESIMIMGGLKLIKFMNTCVEHLELFRLPGEYSVKGGIRKLSYFPDKEGKTRVIAVADYFSQTVLKGLHNYLFKVLKKIPQDCTFDQNKFKESALKWPIVYSADLSSATDRFPVILIARVLKAHLPESYVNAWLDIMTGYPFRFTPFRKKPIEISYEVGNPMGLYSSWASFTLTHHYIIYRCCKQLGLNWRKAEYFILGDDIIIGNKDLGELYLKEMSELGVNISKPKSHISPKFFEFAKRWFYLGEEISPFPLQGFISCKHKYFMLTEMIFNLQERGWSFLSEIPQMIYIYYGLIGRPARFKKQMRSLSTIFLHTAKAMREPLNAHQHLNVLGGLCGFKRLYFYNAAKANAFLSNVVKNLFEKNMQLDNKKPTKYPLGDFATNLLINLTSLEDTNHTNILLDNPLLHSAGSIESDYLKVLHLSLEAKRRCEEISILSPSEINDLPLIDWPSTLRTITIPLDDGIFIERSTSNTTMGTAKLAKAIIYAMMELEATHNHMGTSGY